MANRRGGIKFTWTNLRFDSRQIIKHMNKAEANFLRHFGATVRMYARRSMRNKPTRQKSLDLVYPDGRPVKAYPASPPGKPPFAHSKALKDAIRFAYSIKDKNVIIGPPPAGSKIAQLLEEGGTQRVRILTGRETRPGRNAGALIVGGPSKTTVVRYPARPFMLPAFIATRDKIDQLFDGKGLTRAFENSIRSKLKTVG